MSPHLYSQSKKVSFSIYVTVRILYNTARQFVLSDKWFVSELLIVPMYILRGYFQRGCRHIIVLLAEENGSATSSRVPEHRVR